MGFNSGFKGLKVRSCA